MSGANSNTPTRIILCGKRIDIGEIVIEALKPDIEVIHFTISLDQSLRDIPLILSGQHNNLDKSEESLGTKNFDGSPDCIFLGGGYTRDDYDQLSQILSGTPESRGIPIFIADLTRSFPPIGPEFARVILERLQVAIDDWRVNPDKESPILY